MKLKIKFIGWFCKGWNTKRKRKPLTQTIFQLHYCQKSISVSITSVDCQIIKNLRWKRVFFRFVKLFFSFFSPFSNDQFHAKTVSSSTWHACKRKSLKTSRQRNKPKKTLRISIKMEKERKKIFFYIDILSVEGKGGICGCVYCIRNRRRKRCRKHIRFEVEREQRGMLESIEYK